MQIELTAEYLASQGLSENFPERFWKKVQITETCWLWIAAKNKDGYGSIGMEGGFSTRTIKAHRASWIMANGPIPEGLDVLHNCKPNKDNPACIRPSHLWVGNGRENLEDATAKCRERGDGSHWNASKLTTEKVIEIRELLAAGVSCAEIARRYGLAANYVSHIKHRHRWGHIP